MERDGGNGILGVVAEWRVKRGGQGGGCPTSAAAADAMWDGCVDLRAGALSVQSQTANVLASRGYGGQTDHRLTPGRQSTISCYSRGYPPTLVCL